MSSSSAALADYRAALTSPGALVPTLASALARLPIAMTTLAVLLYVQRATGSYAVAAVVSAGTLAGESLGAVAQGRWMDRVGPMRPLLLAAGLYAVAATGLILVIENGAAIPVLVAAAALSGLVRPAMPGASRALWGRLVPAGPRRDAAYSYEAISLETFFILGPALAAFLVTAPWPGTALVVAVSGMVVGTTVFALSRPVRTQEPAVGGPSIGLLGAVARPGMRTVALASLGFGLVIGSVEVGVNAVATEQGSPTLGGVLLSAWSVASVLAGILYSLRPWPRPLHLRMPFLLGAFAVCVAAMALVGPLASLPVLVVAMLAAGALITPQVTAHSLGVEATAPAGTATEGFGWIVTAAVLGISAGQVAAGVAVDVAGAASSFLVGGLAGAVMAGMLWWRRATLAPQPQEALARA
ncbi:MFS transporter [Pseudonocardia petroleophila]|uniref:MFS transporter n=1 Tax=Pseudonocardia petroleophila TaxID=37331 RepID=A0A7G7MMN4_9PSEU|nr:MFS transporter [Pseudonocardia petroleophila]QNG54045.1 MFS transporter [Pseudonocardia petroleophila]